jgi:predicted metalloprotease with PDZ domain
MYLKKGRYYDLPDGSDRSGIAISRHGGKTIVCRVAWFSPAWSKGIKGQDALLSIDGISADQISLYSLRCLLSMEGKNVNLICKRGDKRIETSLELQSGPTLTIRLPLTKTKEREKMQSE